MNKLHQIMSEHSETEYNHVIAQEKDWAVLRACSHVRTNLIQWLPIRKEDKVLEIGAGEGALTGTLAHLAGEVTATESDQEKFDLLSVRYQGTENLKLLQGRFSDIRDTLTERYDWILLPEAFAHAAQEVDGNQPQEVLLREVQELLSEGGRVVIASANRLGLKYFAGEKESFGKGYFAGIQGYEDSEKEKTFSRPELMILSEKSGYSSVQVYYPYPDEVLPMSIYSDSYLPKVGELWDNRRNFGQERYVLFDETKAFDHLIQDGLFPVFSNAFLLILAKEQGKDKERLIFTKYSNERGKNYAIRTDILEKEDGSRKARKVACFPEGEQHVENLMLWQEKLGKVYEGTAITLNRCEKAEIGIEMEYLTGETLEEELDHLTAAGKSEEALDKLLSYIHMVEEAGSRKPFVMTEEFKSVFGNRILPPGLLCSEVTDLDMVAGNVIADGDQYIHMDYEWTFAFPIPVRYVVYRIIQNYLYGNVTRSVMEREWLYKRVGLTDLEIEQYTQMESSFQNYIIKDHVPLRLLYDEMTPGCIRFEAEEERRREEAKRNAENNTGIEIFIDSFEIAMTGIYVYGWAVSKSEKKVSFRLLDEKNQDLEVLSTEYLYRRDVAERFKLSGKNSFAGFRIQCKLPDIEATQSKKFTLIGSDGQVEVPYVIPVGKLRLKQSRIGQKIMELRGARDVIQYIAPKDMGLISESDQYRVENQRFDTWRMAHQLSEKELAKQKNTVFAKQPVYTIVVLPGVKERVVRSVESVKRQTYQQYQILTTSWEQISLTAISGDYVAFLEAGDILTKNALYEFTARINQEEQVDMIYSDSDQIDYEKKEYFDPQFKPDYAPVTLKSGNYIGSSIFFKKELLSKIEIDPSFRQATLYDLILKCSEQEPKVVHISNILYHSASPMERNEEQMRELADAWEQGRRALESYYKRRGIACTVQWGKVPLRYVVKRKVTGNPKVSVIIPNQDHIADLDQCLSSIARKTTYDNLEVLVVENNSKQAETFAYYKKMEEKYEKVRLITWDDIFNYSAINNYAVREATGDYYLFLNNDTEVLTCDWIEELIATCQEDQVGVVGCRLYYPDKTLQHAGVILGLGSIAGHLFVKEPGDISGYMGKVVLKQNLSAVTAAAMLCSKEAFAAIGGFDEKLKVALNDVDFCMRVIKAGYQVVYDPEVELFHYESKSRGLDTTPEKKARYDSEAAIFTERWKEVLEKGDPYYNVNLSRTTWNCTFRIPRDV